MSIAKKKSTMGHRIKFARKSVGLSQKDLAKKLNVTDKAVSTYEVGRVMPTILTLREISKLTYKPVSYFMAEQTVESDELEEKIAQIERELAEVKKALKNRKK
jgi:transcriptional regulator with XRE-family HTH domain